MPHVQYKVEKGVDPHLLMSVITDFDSYTQFIPEVIDANIRTKGPPVWEVRFVLRVIRPLEYRLRLELCSDLELRWSLIEGFFSINQGYWKLNPTEKGCSIEYNIFVQLETFLPTSIAKKLQERSIPILIQRFVDEANQRLVSHLKTDQDDN